VSLIHPTLNMQTRSIEIEVKLANRSQLLKPGMFVRVMVEGVQHEGIGIPLTAIINRGSEEYVWLAKNNKSFLQKINRVAVSGDFAIINELDEDAEIIVTKKSQLENGMSIITEK